MTMVSTHSTPGPVSVVAPVAGEAQSIDFAAAVNDREVLATCLERSPDISSGAARLRCYEGYPSAAAAYNQAISDSSAARLVMLHQDVYLPKGFLARLTARLDELDRIDPDWAVAGAVGIDDKGAVHGKAWSSGLRRFVDFQTPLPAPAETLDEMLLVLNRRSGLQFAPDLPSFHLYGTDIVQIAKQRGLKSYVVDLPVIHHSRPTVDLGDPGYRRAYYHMQRKWRADLPLPNLVCPVYTSRLRFWWRDARMRIKARGNRERRAPEGDPVDIARRLGLE